MGSRSIIRKALLSVVGLVAGTVMLGLILSVTVIPLGVIASCACLLGMAFPHKIGLPIMRGFDALRIKIVKHFVRSAMGGK